MAFAELDVSGHLAEMIFLGLSNEVLASHIATKIVLSSVPAAQGSRKARCAELVPMDGDDQGVGAEMNDKDQEMGAEDRGSCSRYTQRRLLLSL